MAYLNPLRGYILLEVSLMYKPTHANDTPHWVTGLFTYLTQHQGAHTVCVGRISIMGVMYCKPLSGSSVHTSPWVEVRRSNINSLQRITKSWCTELLCREAVRGSTTPAISCEAQVKSLNVWWGNKPLGHIKSLKMSTSARLKVECTDAPSSCPRWTWAPSSTTRAISVHASAQVCDMQM